MSDTTLPEEVKVAEVVSGDLPSIAPPRLNDVSLARLDDAVDRIEAAAQAFVCDSKEAYEESATHVRNIRKLTQLYEETFAPIKRWWNERLGEARADEARRTTRLEAAKKLRESKMLTWKNAELKREQERQREQEKLERQRAEERRLAEAEQIAKRQGQAAAVAALDKPLDIAPVRVTSAVPKLSGTGVSTAKRKVVVAKRAYARLSKLAADQNRIMTEAEWKEAQEINGADLEDLIICIGAKLLLERGPYGDTVQAFLQNFSTRSASVDIIKQIDAQWIRTKFAKDGDSFGLGGVEVVLKEGLA